MGFWVNLEWFNSSKSSEIFIQYLFGQTFINIFDKNIGLWISFNLFSELRNSDLWVSYFLIVQFFNQFIKISTFLVVNISISFFFIFFILNKLNFSDLDMGCEKINNLIFSNIIIKISNIDRFLLDLGSISVGCGGGGLCLSTHR